MPLDSARILVKKKKQVLELWMKSQMTSESLREDLISNDELRNSSIELLELLLPLLGNKDMTDIDAPEFEPIVELLSGISIMRAKQGFTPRETAIYIFSLKQSLITTLEAEATNDVQSLYDQTSIINRLMDNFAIVTFETFIKGREEVILRQTDEIAEISTPVIRVWDGILAMPIIGTLDSARTQVVMENLLQEIVDTGSTIAILDISGVPAVDSLVAQHLIKTVSATRLMGAECIISGIRPEIAQTVVHLGIDLSNIITKSTLASALKFAFQSMKLEVKKAAPKQLHINN